MAQSQVVTIAIDGLTVYWTNAGAVLACPFAGCTLPTKVGDGDGPVVAKSRRWCTRLRAQGSAASWPSLRSHRVTKVRRGRRITTPGADQAGHLCRRSTWAALDQ
jgi:hypothetical protein